MPGPMLRRVLPVVLFLVVHASAACADTPLRVTLPAGAEGASGRLLVSLQPAASAEQAARFPRPESPCVRISAA